MFDVRKQHAMFNMTWTIREVVGAALKAGLDDLAPLHRCRPHIIAILSFKWVVWCRTHGSRKSRVMAVVLAGAVQSSVAINVMIAFKSRLTSGYRRCLVGIGKTQARNRFAGSVDSPSVVCASEV